MAKLFPLSVCWHYKQYSHIVRIVTLTFESRPYQKSETIVDMHTPRPFSVQNMNYSIELYKKLLYKPKPLTFYLRSIPGIQ